MLFKERYTRGYVPKERSKLITEYFKDEFNLSGAHGHLVPAIRNKTPVIAESISVLDLCIRKVDSEIIGISNEHLLLFEMGVFGTFGHFNNIQDQEYKQLETLFLFFDSLEINSSELFITVSKGGTFNNEYLSIDKQTISCLNRFGIDSSNIHATPGRQNFMLSRGVDRLAGYNVEFYFKRNHKLIEIASANIYQFLNKLSHLERTVNVGVGCGIGIERLAQITSGLESIYELPPFSNIAKRFMEIFEIKEISHISEKIYRIVELYKTLIFLFNDGFFFTKSTQGRTMRKYLKKIVSDISYLGYNVELLLNIIQEEINKFYSQRFRLTDNAFNELNSEILHSLPERHN